MVPVEMVSTLYFQLLTLVAFPFTPFLSTIFAALLWLINFEFYYLLMNKFFRKPDKPWNSKVGACVHNHARTLFGARYDAHASRSTFDAAFLCSRFCV